ncbi:ABC transporter ATP-binding protein [Psychrobacter sp. HD31]|uniref:ABC transporter ATP-binding protein n=1 Tax=Psychrobacter sp. HD31 TaxID=3112003 RepID=UPI003DA2FC00
MTKTKKPSLLKRLSPYMGDKKYLFTLSLFFSAISAILNLLPFVLIWWIVRDLFATPDAVRINNISLYAWLTLAAALLAMFVYFLALVTSHLAAFRVETGMRRQGMAKIMAMPLGFFDQYSSGKIRKVIDDNASQTHTFLAHQMPDLVGSIVAPIVLLVLLLVVNWRLGIASLIPIALGFFSMRFMMTEEGKKRRQLYMDHLEQMSSEAVEYVRGIPVVKTFGQSVFSFKRFVDSIIGYRDMVYAMTLSWNHPMAFYMVIMQCAAFFLVPLAVIMIGHNQAPAQVLTDFVFYLLIAPNFTLLLMRVMYIQNHSAMALQVVDRFDDMLDYPMMTFPEASETPKDHSLQFQSVSFAYAGADKNALTGISFEVAEGETVALVGASGSGKTTIARLAARFWDVSSGEILIGGVPIKQISQADLMQNIAFVFQNTKLFKTTLRENILYGKEDASEAQITDALHRSQSQEIIDKLPQGLDTVIGKEGTYLSGGEQQRIALARALLKDAPIVLLDEATAFADPENEHLIQQALNTLRQGKTTLMIAHRLSTVVDADKILVIDKGTIAEQGTHEELLALGGVYQQMWQEYQQSVAWRL